MKVVVVSNQFLIQGNKYNVILYNVKGNFIGIVLTRRIILVQTDKIPFQ